MNREDAARKLHTLPWQALFDLALEHQIDEEEVKNKEKSEIISKLILNGISDTEIDQIVDDYIYGTRVTFTLWGFSQNLSDEDILFIKSLEDTEEGWVEADGFRNLHFLSVKDHQDRLEVLYSYSKEYSFTNEEGKADSVWELHRGCLWIGIRRNYLASISKHEKMMICVIRLLEEKLKNSIKQLKPPKKAIERCTNYIAMSRIVLQGTGGEKTAISNSAGFTDEQQKEMERIKGDRFDTSGSYIAAISEETTATVKYNVNKGSLGIYKHISSTMLFDWSKNAIEIILEEIDNLKGKPAEEIFKEVGLEIKWPGYSDAVCYSKLNWFLTQAIAALDNPGEYRITIPENISDICLNEKLFVKLPRVYCNECESYEIPYCANCGEPLTYNRKGELECSCDAPLKITCAEQHSTCEMRPWFIPQKRLDDMLKRNIQCIFKDNDLDFQMCIMGDELYIIHSNGQANSGVEVMFSDITCFKNHVIVEPSIKSFAVRMNEKCDGTCSAKKIDECVCDPGMVCLPKVFYGIIPSFRPQPHKGGEYGDVSGEVKTEEQSYEMIGIIKKNSENKQRGNERTDEELFQKYLLSTSKEGQEIIRQFVEQGMIDSRVQLISVIAPQYFDHGLKGTLRMLARLANKKIMFIGLDELCELIAMNDNIKTA